MFIFNADHHLIAADPKDLQAWGFSDIFDAARAFADGSIRLEREQNLIETTSGEQYPCTINSLDTLLGTWLLVEYREQPLETTERKTEYSEAASVEHMLLEVSENETIRESAPEPVRETEEALSVDQEDEFILDLLREDTDETEPSHKTSSTEEAEEEELIPLKSEEPTEDLDDTVQKSGEEILPLIQEEEPAASQESDIGVEASKQDATEEEEELLSLELAEEPAAAKENREGEEVIELPGAVETPIMPLEDLPETTTAATKSTDESTPLMPLPESHEGPWEEIARRFHPDLDANAAHIDLNREEYRELLTDFIQDSRQLRSQLLSDHPHERQGAVAVLKDAIALLHLSPLDELLGLLDQASPQERIEIVTEYERLLDQIGSEEIPASEKEFETPETLPSVEMPEPASAPEAPLAPLEEPASSPESSAPEPAPQPEEAPEPQATEPENITAKETPSTEIDVEKFLRGVQPIPIEFSLHIAAQELSLPEDLVLEFINDFDKQGHEYLPVLIEAYEKKDLPHLQKTAHMLKGAASNLRIEAMVDNLYALQYDNDIERAPERIRLFAGQLMSLDKYLEQMNSQGG